MADDGFGDIKPSPITAPFINASPEELQALAGGAGMMPDPVGANLLWKFGIKPAWDLITVPGRILEGKLHPQMQPGPNALSVPEYALGLAGLGLGVSGPGMLLRSGATDAATMRSIPFWQGTPVDEPFLRYENRFLGSGEGKTIPSLMFEQAYGHHLSGMPEHAAEYRSTLSSAGTFRSRGALISGEIIPDQEDLLGWRDPFSSYTSELQGRILNGEYGYLMDPDHPKNKLYGHDPGAVQGYKIYENVAREIEKEYEDKGEPLSRAERQRYTSEYFDSIGVPGTRSRSFDLSNPGKPPAELYHIGRTEVDQYGFPKDAPPSLFYDKVTKDPAEFYRTHIEPHGMDLDKVVDSFADHLDTEGRNIRQNYLNNTGDEHDWLGHHFDEYHDTADWVRRQHKLGNLQLAEGTTPSNYIIFDGRHINVTHWDGVPVEKAMPQTDHTIYKDGGGNLFQLGHGPEAPQGLSPSEQQAWEHYFNYGSPPPAKPAPAKLGGGSVIAAGSDEAKAMDMWDKHMGGSPLPKKGDLIKWYDAMNKPMSTWDTGKTASGVDVVSSEDKHLTLDQWMMKQNPSKFPNFKPPPPPEQKWSGVTYPADHPQTKLEMEEYNLNPEAYKNKYPNLYKAYIEPNLPKGG